MVKESAEGLGVREGLRNQRVGENNNASNKDRVKGE